MGANNTNLEAESRKSCPAPLDAVGLSSFLKAGGQHA